MASTWSALKIELLETGANSGTWGTLTNVNLGDAVLGEAITGSATVDFPTDADVTVTLTDSATTQSARNLRLNITESSTGIGSVRSLILGSGCQIEKFYLINNTGTGAKTVKNTTGTGISVPAGKATLVYNNGTNVVDAASYFTSLTLGSALPVASGGTGVTTSTGTTNVVLSNSPTLVAPVLGTPASGTVTNLTGTASININGTVGATTATTGAFTTLSATGTLSGGTSGTAYSFSGSAPATSLTLNSSGNFGVGAAPIYRAQVTAAATNGSVVALGIENPQAAASANLNATVDLRFDLSGSGAAIIRAGKDGDYTSDGNVDGNLQFYTNLNNQFALSAPVERMRLDSSGNVGIGMTPTNFGNGYTVLQVANATNGGMLYLTNTANAGGRIFGNAAGITYDAFSTTFHAFNTNSAERMRIDSSGNVLVGTTTAGSQKFTLSTSTAEIGISFVNTSSTGRTYELISGGSGGAFAGGLFGLYDRTAGASRFAVDSSGNFGIGTTSPRAKFEVNGVGSFSDGNAAAPAITFGNELTVGLFRANNATLAFTTGSTERMRIDSSGNLGIGTASPSSRLSVEGNITLTAASPTISTALNDNFDIKNTNAGGTLRLFSGNSLAIACNSAQVITISNLAGIGSRAVVVNAAGELSAASDSRLKQEVEGQTLPSLAEVMKLEVKAYKWLDDINVRGDGAAIEIGFFADQVAPIIPSAAPMGRDGYYGFYDRSVVAALVNAIKEQQALITQLTARVAQLESKP